MRKRDYLILGLALGLAVAVGIWVYFSSTLETGSW